MGLAASQARAIALHARMNDVEYQGQQINQQRLTLSNQINALYNQLLEMTVPTPPSKTDFTKIQYSGITGASKFTLGAVTPTGKDSTGKDTYSIDFKYERSGHTVGKNSNSAILTNTSQYLGYQLATNSVKDLVATSSETKATVGNAIKNKPNDPNKDVYIAVDVNDYGKWANKSDALDVCDANGNSVKNNLPSSGLVYVRCNVADLDTEEFKAIVGKTEVPEGSEETPEYTNVYDCNESTTSSTGIADWVTDSIVANKNLYYVANPDDKSEVPTLITTVAQLKQYTDNGADLSHIFARDKSSNPAKQFTNPSYDPENPSGLSVGDMKVYDLNDPEIKTKLGESYNDYMTALKNAFQAEYGTGLTDSEIASKFYVYISTTASGAQQPHFIKKDEIAAVNNEQSSVRTYEYDEDGTYEQTENEKGCQLEFDVTTGRITRVGIPDGNGQIQWVDLDAETVTDDDAFEDAFNDYEYEKALYDKKQQEINAKTSIIQQQDKNLELKLTRLDNERNALKTELEAVEKVLQDATESGFKTFSG